MSDEMTLGEALRAIAERTPFRTEDERIAVLDAIDRANDEDERAYTDAADDSEPESKTEQPAEPEKSNPSGAEHTEQPAEPEKPTTRHTRRGR